MHSYNPVMHRPKTCSEVEVCYLITITAIMNNTIFEQVTRTRRVRKLAGSGGAGQQDPQNKRALHLLGMGLEIFTRKMGLRGHMGLTPGGGPLLSHQAPLPPTLQWASRRYAVGSVSPNFTGGPLSLPECVTNAAARAEDGLSGVQGGANFSPTPSRTSLLKSAQGVGTLGLGWAIKLE